MNRIRNGNISLKAKLECLIEEFNMHFYGYRPQLFHAAVVSYLTHGRLMLIGKHGRGKSSFARTIAQIGNLAFVAYDASKADSNIIAGFLDPRQATEGEGIPFLRHGATIWNKEVVFIDELNRASYQNQNLLLEIMEEKSLFGWPLDQLKLVIAAANAGAGYQATLDLDSALFDRFSTILFIREEPLDFELVKQLMEKTAAPFQPSSQLEAGDQAAFSQAVVKLSELHRSTISEFAGDFVVALQSMLDFEFSDRTVLQFRQSLYAYWAFYSMLELPLEETLIAAVQNATEFSLINKARSLGTEDDSNSQWRKPELTQYISDQAKELSIEIQSAVRKDSNAELLVNRMFHGTATRRLSIFETNYEEIKASDTAWQNSILALEKIISTADTPTLRRISQLDLYSTEQKVRAEFRMIQYVLENLILAKANHDWCLDGVKFAEELCNPPDGKKSILTNLMQGLSPVPWSVSQQEIDEFFDTATALGSACYREHLRAGMLLVSFSVPVTFIDPRSGLPEASREMIASLKPYLYKVDSGNQFDLFAVAQYRNGIRKGDDTCNPRFSGKSYLLPSFAMPAYFANCLKIDLPQHLRASTYSMIASLIDAIAAGRTSSIARDASKETELEAFREAGKRPAKRSAKGNRAQATQKAGKGVTT